MKSRVLVNFFPLLHFLFSLPVSGLVAASTSNTQIINHQPSSWVFLFHLWSQLLQTYHIHLHISGDVMNLLCSAPTLYASETCTFR